MGSARPGAKARGASDWSSVQSRNMRPGGNVGRGSAFLRSPVNQLFLMGVLPTSSSLLQYLPVSSEAITPIFPARSCREPV